MRSLASLRFFSSLAANSISSLSQRSRSGAAARHETHNLHAVFKQGHLLLEVEDKRALASDFQRPTFFDRRSSSRQRAAAALAARDGNLQLLDMHDR